MPNTHNLRVNHDWTSRVRSRSRPCVVLFSVVLAFTAIGCSTPTVNEATARSPRSESDRAPSQALPALEEFESILMDRSPQPTELMPTGPLSLQTLEQLAKQHNPTLMQAVALVEGEKGIAMQAGLWPNPLLGYRGAQLGQKGTLGEFQGGFIQQKFITGGKLRLSREKYLARVSAAEFQALSQIYVVLNGVRIQYFRTLGAQRRLAIERELLKTAEDHLVTTKEMFNVGQANRADLHQATVVLNDQQLSVLMAENHERMHWERLATVVGVLLPPGELQGALEGDLQPLTFQDALDRILTQSPQLAQARALLKSDQIKVQRELVEPIPNVFVRADVGRNYSEMETVGGVRAWIEVPVFDWNQGTVLQAKADVRRQEHQVHLVELQLRRTLAEQFDIYLSALQHVRSYQNVILPESESRYQTRLKSYQEDRIRWLDVLEAHRDLSSRWLTYIDQLTKWRMAQVAIEGLLLVDGLTSPPGVTPAGHIDATPKPR